MKAHDRIEVSKKARREGKIGGVEGRGGHVSGVIDQQMTSLVVSKC